MNEQSGGLPSKPIKSNQSSRNREHYTFYGKGGNEVEESESFAKSVTYETANYFFVWYFRGEIYDPYGMDVLRRSQTAISKYVKVKKIVFDNYVRYLKTKNKAFYNIARREYMK